MNSEDESEDITTLACRGQLAPETLTEEEIRRLAMTALCDLYDSGDGRALARLTQKDLQ